MPFIGRLIVTLLTGAALAVVTGQPVDAQGARAGSVRIALRASPETVPADGVSVSRVRIEVRDRITGPVPDGTPVFVRVDNGALSVEQQERRESLTVLTSGGFATVEVTSETPGAAVVSASVRDSRNEVMIQFLPEGEAAEARIRMVNIRGGWVAYSPELELIQARDSARAHVGPLVFEGADGIELNIAQNTLRGWGARVSRNGEAVDCEDFFYDLLRRRGVLRRFGDDGVERVFFNIYTLEGPPEGWETPVDAFRRDDREADTWLVARGAQYFIGQKIVLRHSALYVGADRVLSLPPYWVFGMPGYTGVSNTQILGASSEGGLGVNLPLFYRVSEDWAGSVRIQRGVSGSTFMARDGWSVGLAEEYDTGRARGVIEAGGLLQDDWGLEWRDERRLFGNSQGFFNVSWPDHRSLFADASIYSYSDAYRFNFRAQYDNPSWEGSSYRAAADWLTSPRGFVGGATYRLGATTGVRSVAFEDNRWTFENDLYAAVDLRPWRLGDGLTLTPSFSNLYAWDTSGYEFNSVRAQFRAAGRARHGHAGVSYTFGHRSGDTSRPGINQSLSMDLSYWGHPKVHASGGGSWDMTRGDNYGYLSADWRVAPLWRVGLLGTHYDFAETRYDDVELELARRVGNREVGLRYSLDRGRISLEFGGLGTIR